MSINNNLMLEGYPPVAFDRTTPETSDEDPHSPSKQSHILTFTDATVSSSPASWLDSQLHERRLLAVASALLSG